MIGFVKPNIEINKTYYCDITYERNHRLDRCFSHIGTITRVEDATYNIIDEQPEEHTQPTNNDSTIEIAYKSKKIKQYHVNQINVIYTNKIIKEYTHKLITVEEAITQIKHIQNTEQKGDNV
ncbi:MAG: hypothetical protein ACKPKO_58535, partial [Candidatus Fonsibacter sp.]